MAAFASVPLLVRLLMAAVLAASAVTQQWPLFAQGRFTVEGREGVRIQQVDPDMPAALAGFRQGDIIIEFDGERVRGVRQFTRLVHETPRGREVAALVLRDGNRVMLNVTPVYARRPFTPPGTDLPRLPAPERRFEIWPDLSGGQTPAAGARLGVSTTTVDDQLADYFGVEGGVLVRSVDAGSPAARAGLRAGDIITRVGSRAVRAPSDVTQAIESAGPGGALDVQVMRDRTRVDLQVTMPTEEQEAPRDQRFRL
jgi:serine protease Do